MKNKTNYIIYVLSLGILLNLKIFATQVDRSEIENIVDLQLNLLNLPEEMILKIIKKTLRTVTKNCNNISNFNIDFNKSVENIRLISRDINRFFNDESLKKFIKDLRKKRYQDLESKNIKINKYTEVLHHMDFLNAYCQSYDNSINNNDYYIEVYP